MTTGMAPAIGFIDESEEVDEEERLVRFEEGGVLSFEEVEDLLALDNAGTNLTFDR